MDARGKRVERIEELIWNIKHHQTKDAFADVVKCIAKTCMSTGITEKKAYEYLSMLINAGKVAWGDESHKTIYVIGYEPEREQ